MEMIYNVNDRPQFKHLIVFAFQQLLAIMAATIAVPMIVGHGMSPAAALFGAGVGTIVYQLFTKFRSPVFLGSSFAFLGSMAAAFAGGVSMSLGYLGLIIGAVMAGLVYVVIAVVVKFCGVKWIDKLMPAVVIGPVVAIIGLSLSGNAVGDLLTAPAGGSSWIAFLCGIVTLGVTIVCSTYGNKALKLIPFVVGIGAGYLLALIFTLIGNATGADALKVINLAPFQALLTDGKVTFTTFLNLPDFSFLKAFSGNYESGLNGSVGAYIGSIAVAYIPVAFVVFAEHLADHKNLSSILSNPGAKVDLLENPGLTRTLLGDGIGSMAGAFFGGCPNTTYGESIGCVAITKNASVASILTAAILAIVVSFISPFVALLESIPNCVMGGVCMSLYGFIAVSGLKMIQGIDLGNNKNLFTVSVILITGVGGLELSIGNITLRTVACALILGVLTNLLCSIGSKAKADEISDASANAKKFDE